MKMKSQTCYLIRPATWTGRLTRGARRARRRRAAVLLELIVTLPILAIIVIASVQFGLYYQNMQQVSLASRVGAREAAETTSLPDESLVPPPAPVPSAIVAAITQQLSSSGIDPCAVILEHNVNSSSSFTEQTLRSDIAPDCPACEEPSSMLPSRTVRVTVCVKMSELMPNCLKMFGFDISTYTSQSSTTVSYEVP